jgi:hypothetical protein
MHNFETKIIFAPQQSNPDEKDCKEMYKLCTSVQFYHLKFKNLSSSVTNKLVLHRITTFKQPDSLT